MRVKREVELMPNVRRFVRKENEQGNIRINIRDKTPKVKVLDNIILFITL